MKTALGTAPLSPWAVDVFRAAIRSHAGADLAGAPPTLTGTMREAWEKGSRAGWAAANKVLREALDAASTKLKGMRP
jgi:hypothetical protein